MVNPCLSESLELHVGVFLQNFAQDTGLCIEEFLLLSRVLFEYLRTYMVACFVAGSTVTNGVIEDARRRTAILQKPEILKQVASRHIEVNFLKRACDL